MSYRPAATCVVLGLVVHGNAVAMTLPLARLRSRKATLRAPTCAHVAVWPLRSAMDHASEIEPFVAGGGVVAQTVHVCVSLEA